MWRARDVEGESFNIHFKMMSKNINELIKIQKLSVYD